MVGDTKVSLPILKDIMDRLGLPDPDLDPLEGLTFPSFQQAAKNYYAFEKERDAKGAAGGRAIWTSDHVMFFVNQRDAEAYYRFWKPREYRLRRQRQDYEVPFEISSYEMQWALVEEEARRVEASITYPPYHGNPTQSSFPAPSLSSSLSSGSAQAIHPHQSGPSYYQSQQPFPKGNKGKTSDLCCLACGKKGHSAREHMDAKFEPPIWARWFTQNGELVLGLKTGPERRL
ncbi:hypothetical protein EV360DRAFT_88651 [Lentinula raphanica]|nr:hypothetical protein EV360DRAFT_88651 [Lentinula raphanica]